MAYSPPQEILEKYADVLINFALNSGQGVKKNEVVFLQVPDTAKPLLKELYKKTLQAGAHPMIQFIPEGLDKIFFENASDEQLKFFPAKYLKEKVNLTNHFVGILADADPKELEGIDPKKMMMASASKKKYKDWRDQKEAQGRLTWTLALFATPAQAKEAHLTLEEYWTEIIKACFLDTKDPVAKWKEVFLELERIRTELNKLKIEKLHLEAQNTDLWVQIGPNRQWLGGSGRNIPSFELFISPDWHGTNGYVAFTEPLYAYGNLITEVKLEFKNGVVVNSLATKGEKVLQEMIRTKDADKIGEFSLTDSRMSKITKFMANTLFDENVGGKYGNTHIALGSSYHDSFPGDQSKVKKGEWKKMGYNDSVVHTDIVATSNRTVTAHLKGGKTKVIYQNGKFTV